METGRAKWMDTLSPSKVPPSGGSLEIGNCTTALTKGCMRVVPPSGGSLEIGNMNFTNRQLRRIEVPPSGGSLEIGNSGHKPQVTSNQGLNCSPFGGIPRNWKLLDEVTRTIQFVHNRCSPFGGIPRNWKLALPRMAFANPWGSGFPLRGDP